MSKKPRRGVSDDVAVKASDQRIAAAFGLAPQPRIVFKASVKIEMLPVSADETTEQRILREQAQARLDAFADRVARQLEGKLREDERICERVDALNKEWDKLVKSGAVTFVEF